MRTDASHEPRPSLALGTERSRFCKERGRGQQQLFLVERRGAPAEVQAQENEVAKGSTPESRLVCTPRGGQQRGL